MANKNISENRSFTGWSAWQWLSGRKRSAITAVTALLGYFIIDQGMVGLLVGPVFEAVWAVASFYFSKVNLK